MKKRALLTTLAAICKGSGIVLLTLVGLLATGFAFTLAWDTLLVPLLPLRAVNLPYGILAVADYYLLCSCVYVLKASK